MTTALILRDPQLKAVAFTPEAEAAIEAALVAAASIASVNNAEENEAACAADRQLKSVLRDIEKARVECKQPFLDYGRAIDDAVRTRVTEPKAEEMRVNRLIGNFAQRQLQLQREREAEHKKQLLELERQKAAELAKVLADTAKPAAEVEKAVEKVTEQFNARAFSEVPPPPPAARAKGQVITEDWDFEVTDVWLLARAHPICIKMEVLRSEVKNLLNAGVDVKGIRASRVVKTSTRGGRQPEAINV